MSSRVTGAMVPLLPLMVVMMPTFVSPVSGSSYTTYSPMRNFSGIQVLCSIRSPRFTKYRETPALFAYFGSNTAEFLCS